MNYNDTASAPQQVEFRPLEYRDLPVLVEWLAQPAVARWWNQEATLESVVAKYAPRIEGRDATRMWIVEVEGVAAGLLQSYRHSDYPEHDTAVGVPDAAGIDYLLADSHRGRGLGTLVLRCFAVWVLDQYADCESCVATPAQANEASWRTLEAAGFVRRLECQPPEEPPAFVYSVSRSSLSSAFARRKADR